MVNKMNMKFHCFRLTTKSFMVVSPFRAMMPPRILRQL
uniref:Uncharacterized protein n=1 Tax=Arundo donax TaxID=35708 RepID=A0A0A9EQ38_ARUDO